MGKKKKPTKVWDYQKQLKAQGLDTRVNASFILWQRPPLSMESWEWGKLHFAEHFHWKARLDAMLQILPLSLEGPKKEEKSFRCRVLDIYNIDVITATSQSISKYFSF